MRAMSNVKSQMSNGRRRSVKSEIAESGERRQRLTIADRLLTISRMINIPQRILLGPGPSDTPARVLEALGRRTIGHLDPVFLQLMDDIRAKLKEVFRTKNEMTMAMSGTGS